MSRSIGSLSCGGVVRVVKSSLAKHRDGDRENTIHDTSESSCVGVASVAKSFVVLLEGVVLKDGNAGPMMESIVQGQRASSPHEDFGISGRAYRFFV